MGSFLAFWGPNGILFELGQGSKAVLGSALIDSQLLFSENCSFPTLSYSLEFVWGGGGGGVPTNYLVAPVLNWPWLRQKVALFLLYHAALSLLFGA